MAEVLFKRKIYSKLKEWKETSKGKTALLIEGARRIGKSTIVEEFAKKEYRSYILIDFNEAPSTPHGYTDSPLLATAPPSPVSQTPLSSPRWHTPDYTYHQNTPSACPSQSACTSTSSTAEIAAHPSGILQRQATSQYSCSLPASAARCYNNPNPHFFC